jgi:hypothetical protein
MGRQLILAATTSDELELLRFVRGLAPIRVFQSFGRSIDDLWITDWEREGIPEGAFRVWPQTFPWTPKYAQTGGPNCPVERAGLFYVANDGVAPVWEVTRSFLEDRQRPDNRRFGRIYWARDFAAPHGLDYDTAAFAKLTDSVWRWIRKAGRRLPGAEPYSPYFLPDAWARHGNGSA